MTIDTSTLPKPEYKISYDTTPSIAGESDSGLTVSFDASTNYGTVTAPSTPISINVDNNALGTEWQRQTFDNWPSEVIIEDMIKKYPGLKLQYEKFKTVYDLVKDDYTYEEPVNDGSV